MQKNNTIVYKVILQDLKSIKSENKIVHINWILSHTQISENELTDQAVKKDIRNSSTEIINALNKQLSMFYIKTDINKIAEEK